MVFAQAVEHFFRSRVCGRAAAVFSAQPQPPSIRSIIAKLRNR